MTSPQVLFILLILLLASLMFFYLGAKFGSDILTLAEEEKQTQWEPFLPNQELTKEIEKLLATRTHDFIFHEALEEKISMPGIEKSKEKKYSLTKNLPVEVEKEKVETKPVEKPQVVKTAPKVNDEPKVATKQKELPATVIPISQVQPQRHELTKKSTSSAISVAESTSSKKANFRLQVGSYQQKSRALEALKEWQKRGFSAQVVSTNIPGKGRWFRIQLGSYADQGSALQTQREVMQKYQQFVRLVANQSK